MTSHLFRNRRHRIYFQLMDAFAEKRCPLCELLKQEEMSRIAAFLPPLDPRKPIKSTLKELCAVHRIRLKEMVAAEPSLWIMLMTALREALHEVAHPHRHSIAGWRRWVGRVQPGCPLCRRHALQERMLCRMLIQFLNDTDFWKGFQKAALLCMDHLEKCLTIGRDGIEFKRLLNDQGAKLNALLNDLVRFEATGTHEESKSVALDWLGDFAGPGLDGGEGAVASAEADPAPAAQADPIAPDQRYQEELLFENEKLARKVKDLMERLTYLETRAASLGYQVARLSEDNKRLEMGYTGANAQADGLKQLVQDLRNQIEQLKREHRERVAKAAS